MEQNHVLLWYPLVAVYTWYNNHTGYLVTDAWVFHLIYLIQV